MPCMGPTINQQQVDKAYEEIMLLLKEKYGIQKHPPIIDEEQARVLRNVYNDLFKSALADLFMRQDCEDF
jgi:hypothetical protein